LNNHECDENVGDEERLSLFKVKLLFCLSLYNAIIIIIIIIQQQTRGFKVHEMNSQPILSLVKNNEESNTLEEAIFIAHGIILEKDLPPVKIERYHFYSRLHIVQN